MMNKKMKSIGCLLLALLLVCSLFLTGCGEDEPEETIHVEPSTIATVVELPTEPATVAPTQPVETEAPSVEETTEAPTETVAETTEAPTEEEVSDKLKALRKRYGEGQMFVVTGTESLNMRGAASTDSVVIGVLSKNAGGQVVDASDPEWLKVKSAGMIGYVSKEFVVYGMDAEKKAEKNAVRYIVVTEDIANIRDAASLDSNVISSAAKGEMFLRLGAEGDFRKIQYHETEAYIAKSVSSAQWYLREAEPTGETPLETEDNSNPNQPSQGESAAANDPAASVAADPTAPSANPVTPGQNGLVVCIDPGHQQYGISDLEPNGPGSSVMKAKLTTGTQGCATGIPEYEINLQVSLKLQSILQERGYTVVMVRTTNDCPMSNAERAQLANNSGANIFVRVHCNSHTDASITGIINYAPTAANPYLNGDLINASNSLSAILADSMCAATGAVNRGVLQDDTMSGINWCQIPVTIVEMGFMSNPTEDALLADGNYQTQLATGMANGIDTYFGR